MATAQYNQISTTMPKGDQEAPQENFFDILKEQDIKPWYFWEMFEWMKRGSSTSKDEEYFMKTATRDDIVRLITEYRIEQEYLFSDDPGPDQTTPKEES